MIQTSSKVMLCAAIAVTAACTPAIGTRVRVADAHDFAERAATREQVLGKLGKPDVTTTSERGVCDSYLWTGKVNPFGGPHESSSAKFCYDDKNVLILKNVTETE